MSQSSRQRYGAIVFVGALHILILEIIIHGPRSQQFPSDDTTAWSTLFFVPAEAVRIPPPVKSKPRNLSPLARPRLQPPAAEVALPITTTPDATQGKASVDWMSELRTAATAVAGSQSGSGASEHGTPADSSSIWAPRVHFYGEQYQLRTGETVVWVSDHCYLVSEPPIAGTPSAFAHSALTHTACQAAPGPRSDMFKDLPAYEKFHPTQ